MIMSATHMQLGSTSVARAGAPLAAPHINAMASQRTGAHMMPALGHQSHLDTLLDKLLNPGIPDNQDLYSLVDVIDRARAEQIMSYIVEQLGRGPESLEKTDLLDKVNAALPGSFEQLDTEGWHAVLQETLMIAIQKIKVFDDGGLRKLTTIHADAAILLDLDADEFAAWETHFCISAIADNLIVHDKVASADEDDLIQLIRQQIIERACNAFERGDYRDALLYSFETRIQWAVARHSAIEESDDKISTTAAFISDTAQENRIAVSRFLALVVRHSRLSRDKIRRTHPLIPHWRTGEVRKLVALVMEEMPNIMGDSCLRTQLTEREKTALNKAIIKANYESIMTTLSRMSSDRPIEDFLDAIAESDEGGTVLLDIVLTMARNRENQDVN